MDFVSRPRMNYSHILTANLSVLESGEHLTVVSLPINYITFRMKISSMMSQDLTRAKELMKAIRRGDVGENWIREFFKESEKRLEKAYQESTLPYVPREAEIKDLLFQCIEMHYGDLKQIVPKEDAYRRAFEEISSVVSKHRNLL
jgi:hypothetical protein